MTTTLRIAALAIATLAALPAVAQTAGRGGGNAGPSGPGEAAGGSLHDAVEINLPCRGGDCVPGGPILAPVRQEKSQCGQQLTFGREAIFYYGRCDRSL